MSEQRGWNRCVRCRLVLSRCICADLPSVENRTEVLIVQHPKERHHPIGTARFVDLGLARSRIVMAVASGGNALERPRLRAPEPFPEGAALLFPSDDARDLATLEPSERPECLVVIDGTWSQAKRLFLDDPRLDALPKVRFTPEQESRYRIRREPQKDYVSTVESIAEALTLLEPETEGLDLLVDSFERMVVKQEQVAKGPDRQPRYQSRRKRESRRIPEAMHSDGLVVVYGEMANAADDLPEVVQWSWVRPVDELVGDALIAPRTGMARPRHLAHAELDPVDVLDGVPIDALRAEFHDSASPSVLAAWGNRPLAIARDHLGWDGPSVNLRVVYSNLRGKPEGDCLQVAQSLGCELPELPVRGRAARRLAAATQICRWIRSSSPRSGG